MQEKYYLVLGCAPILSPLIGLCADVFSVQTTVLFLLAYFPYFETNRSRLMRSSCCLCIFVYPPP
jgi:hypothetical protein